MVTAAVPQGVWREQSERPREEQAARLRQRARELLSTEIEFVDHPDFRTCPAPFPVEVTVKSGLDRADRQKLGDLPAHLARLCESTLLTADQERELFRSMNYLKFRANALRAQLNPEAPDEAAVAEIERLLEGAQRIRDRLIQANMRLAISVVKKFVSPQRSFDDLLSDGIFSLMLAVDKFDFSRGFRFSTYAYRAIARNAYRKIHLERRESTRVVNHHDEVNELEDQGSRSSLDERTWELLRGALADLMGRLDRREQFILRGRYALGRHRKSKTFQSLADKLGLSKERVRQLEQRAVAKLRQWSGEVRVPA